MVANDVGRELLDLGAQLKLLQPLARQRLPSEEGAQDVAGDRAGAVAVAAVVDSERDALAEVVADERAIDGDRQSLLGDPALAE